VTARDACDGVLQWPAAATSVPMQVRHHHGLRTRGADLQAGPGVCDAAAILEGRGAVTKVANSLEAGCVSHGRKKEEEKEGKRSPELSRPCELLTRLGLLSKYTYETSPISWLVRVWRPAGDYVDHRSAPMLTI